jgi:hypothetical protein
MLCLGLAFALWFYWGYIPASSLPVEVHPELDLSKSQLCPKRPFPMRFPYYSPDGKYYVTDTQSWYRKAEVVSLYKAGSNQYLGSYSYLQILVDCWTNDSNGVYIEDYVTPGMTDIGLDIGPFGGGDVKKALVPCQSSLAKISLLLRLYWQFMCGIRASKMR